MARELGGLVVNETCKPTSWPKRKNTVGSTWIFTYKRNHYGEVVRFKARLVAKGLSQLKGQNYRDIFCPTPSPSPSSIKLLVAVALDRGLDLYHSDAKQVFVQSELDNEIYMRLPERGGLAGSVVLLITL